MGLGTASPVPAERVMDAVRGLREDKELEVRVCGVVVWCW